MIIHHILILQILCGILSVLICISVIPNGSFDFLTDQHTEIPSSPSTGANKVSFKFWEIVQQSRLGNSEYLDALRDTHLEYLSELERFEKASLGERAKILRDKRMDELQSRVELFNAHQEVVQENLEMIHLERLEELKKVLFTRQHLEVHHRRQEKTKQLLASMPERSYLVASDDPPPQIPSSPSSNPQVTPFSFLRKNKIKL